MYRPYPDPARALRQIQRTRAVYRYGRFPQRCVMGMDRPELVATLIDVFGSMRPDLGPTAASLDDLPRNSRWGLPYYEGGFYQGWSRTLGLRHRPVVTPAP